MRTALLFCVVLGLSGCAIKPLNGEAIYFQGNLLLSESAAKQLPREDRITSITNNMKQVGFTQPKVSYLFDTYSDTVLDIYTHQYELMSEYKALLDHHRDVTSFLMANADKTEEEIEQAAQAFDASAREDSEKIGPKLTRYQAATDKIWQQNAKLSLQITAQALELSSVLYSLHLSDKKAKAQRQKEAENTSQTPPQRKQTNNLQNFLAADLLNMLNSADKTYQAYKLAEARLHLAKVANDFIKDEQAVISISKQLQEIQNEQ